MADTEIDYSDPCAVLAILRPVYYQLLTGALEAEIRIGDRSVKYSQTSLTTLADEVAKLEGACAAKNGVTGQRYAMRLGSRR